MLTAARLVRLSQRFNSSIQLRLGARVANARSILGVMLLGATLNTCLEVEAVGSDEIEAVRAVEEFFADPNAMNEWTPDIGRSVTANIPITRGP